MQGISDPERAVLKAVAANPGARPKALNQVVGRMAGVPHCATILTRLHQKGLVRMQNGGWHMTDAGRRAAGI